MLSRQQPNGLFAGRNRKYLGYHHVVPGLFYAAAAIPELAPDLIAPLAAMLRAVLDDKPLAGDPDIGQILALAGQFFSRYGSQTEKN